MLEGLEIAEIKLSICENIIDFRIDANTYKKEYLASENTINKFKTQTIGSISVFVQNFGAYSLCNDIRFVDEGIPFLMTQNVRQNYIDWNSLRYVDSESHKMLYKSHCKRNYLLITMAGEYLGRVAVYNKDFVCSSNQAIAKVRLKENVNPYFVSTFLNTKFGQNQINRFKTITGQPNINMSLIKELVVPVIPQSIESQISNWVKKSETLSDKAKSLYSSAETYLLECLGMTEFAANPDAYNIKTLKKSFLETGRFDAEYYLPKYEDYCRLVQSYTNGYEPLSNACNIKDINYTPEAGVRYKYIELANIGKSGEITGCDIQDGENLPTRARRIVHQGDVIVSSIEGSLDSCALVTDDYEGALCSTGFYVLQSSKLNPETLLTLFKSLPIQQLMKKGCSGTILTAISKPELEKLPVPIIRQEVQDQIARHVQRSFTLRKEAMKLLENAKVTVEQAIEIGGGNLLIFNKLQNTILQEERHAAWLLLTEIGVLPETEDENKTVKAYKKLSDSFLSSGRLDAEYYHPKYDYLFSHLNRFATSTIGKLTDIRKSIEPGSDAYREIGVPFIRVSDLSKFGLSDTTIHLNAEDYHDVIRPQKDTILLSKDGSVGIAYKVDDPLDIITSGAILHLSLKSSDVLPDYLTLVLNSPVVRLQAERDAGGSIIQHWKPSEIENVVVPVLPMPVQREITRKIQDSFRLRKESKELLNEAKRKVEMTIERAI